MFRIIEIDSEIWYYYANYQKFFFKDLVLLFENNLQ